jgi:hypothetical protein
MNTDIDPPLIAHDDDGPCFHRVRLPNNIACNKDGGGDEGKKKKKSHLCDDEDGCNKIYFHRICTARNETPPPAATSLK